MFSNAVPAASLIAAVYAAPAPQVSTGAAPRPVVQIPDGQIQNVATITAQANTPIMATASESASTITTSPYGPYSYPQMPTPDLSAASAAASYAGVPISEIPGATNAIPPVVSSQVTGVTSHGAYNGSAPTTTGAVSNSPAATAIPMLPPNPTALKYNPNGLLNDQQPIPYQPAGGLGTNGTEPVYRVQSDFD
jgi:hypothetical protein